MKVKKSFVIIIILITVIIFSAAAMCDSCRNDPPSIDTSNANNNSSASGTTLSQTQDSQKDTAKTISAAPINGVIPTKVTGFSVSDDSKEVGTLECWNVGEYGGRDFSKATYTISSNGKTIKTYDGYFKGGPNGKLFLGIKGEESGIAGDFVDGKKVVLDNGDIITIANPETFDGWTDEIPSEDSAKDFSSDVDVITSEKSPDEADSNLIHGVVPTKVTGHSTGSGQSKDVGILEFWNVGKLGGEQYSKATYIMTRDGKTIATWEGYFTGGPNGEIYLSGDTELHGKLVDGKQLVGDGHGFADIDNPEAFNGWSD
jgi:hypothetical protein